MKTQMFRSALALSLCLSFLFLTSCDQLEDVFPIGKDKPEMTKTYYGPATTVGEGTVRAWVKTKKDGRPIDMGMEVSAKALANLKNMPSKTFFLSLPGQATVTLYKTLTIDWNEMGHEPEGVYMVPHFDFHFYMMTKDQVMDVAGGVDKGANTLQDKGVMPANYTFGPDPIAVPHMGVHWVDVTSPEYTPAGFSKTFVYGSNQDKITFLEPMITTSYLLGLQANESVKTAIPSLLKFEEAGYYPASYTVTYDAHEDTYMIALTDLMWHSAN